MSESHPWQGRSLRSRYRRDVLGDEQQLQRGLKKLFMQIALGRLQIQGKKPRVSLLRNQQHFLIYDKRNCGVHTAQTSKSSWTPLHEQETRERSAGLGLATRTELLAAWKSLSHLLPLSPVPATSALCRHLLAPFQPSHTLKTILHIILQTKLPAHVSVHLLPLETDPYSKSHKNNITLGDILDKNIFNHKTGFYLYLRRNN